MMREVSLLKSCTYKQWSASVDWIHWLASFPSTSSMLNLALLSSLVSFAPLASSWSACPTSVWGHRYTVLSGWSRNQNWQRHWRLTLERLLGGAWHRIGHTSSLSSWFLGFFSSRQSPSVELSAHLMVVASSYWLSRTLESEFAQRFVSVCLRCPAMGCRQQWLGSPVHTSFATRVIPEQWMVW